MIPKPSAPRVSFTYPVDQTMRKLKVSPQLKPYIEKHRLAELMSHLTREILSEKPKDVLRFVREQLVMNQKHKGDVPKVVLLAPPHVNASELAKYMCRHLDCVPITLNGILARERANRSKADIQYVESLCNQNLVIDSNKLTQTLARILTGNADRGWILVDFPRDKEEAQHLLHHNVVPNHVISLVSNPEATNFNMQKYKSTVMELKQVYRNVFKEINVCGKDMHCLGDAILKSVRIPMWRNIPLIPRVVILGPRGSGRRSLGDKIEDNLKAVHFNMIQTFSNVDTKFQYEKCQELLFKLGEDSCIESGYIITGFPRNVQEFRSLDQSDNPPNRIIFLELSDDICVKQHGRRCFNIYTGQMLSKRKVVDERHKQCTSMKHVYATHPDDKHWRIKADLVSYRTEQRSLMNYSGKSAIVIDAACCMDILYERVMRAILGPTLVSHDRLCDSQKESEQSLQASAQKKVCSDENKLKFMIQLDCKDNSVENVEDKIRQILREE